MKKILVFLLALTVAITMASCSSSAPTDANASTQPEETTVITTEAVPVAVTETDNLALEYLVVDDSYRDKDNSPRRALYAFFTVTAGSANIDFDSKYMDITINNTNEYTSEVLPGTLCEFAPNYIYSGYIEEAYVGETKKLVVTFLVPEGDLVAGKEITFSDMQFDGIEKLLVFTDDIIHVNGDDEACKVADPEGYEEIKNKYEEATPEVAEKIKSLINGRYWEAYVNPSWYTVEFSAPNNFVVKTSFGSNGGTYSVRNGFIFCTYDSNGVTVEIPYEVSEKGVKMDLGEAFRIN